MPSVLAGLLLVNMRFDWWNAVLLFVLWLVQFLDAELRNEVTIVYAAWSVIIMVTWLRNRPVAPMIFWRLLRRAHVKPA